MLAITRQSDLSISEVFEENLENTTSQRTFPALENIVHFCSYTRYNPLHTGEG